MQAEVVLTQFLPQFMQLSLYTSNLLPTPMSVVFVKQLCGSVLQMWYSASKQESKTLILETFSCSTWHTHQMCLQSRGGSWNWRRGGGHTWGLVRPCGARSARIFFFCVQGRGGFRDWRKWGRVGAHIQWVWGGHAARTSRFLFLRARVYYDAQP